MLTVGESLMALVVRPIVAKEIVAWILAVGPWFTAMLVSDIVLDPKLFLSVPLIAAVEKTLRPR